MLARKNDPSLKNKTENLTFKNILQNAQKAAKDKQIVEIDDSMVIDAAKKEIKQLNSLFSLPNMRQKTLENFLGILRDDRCVWLDYGLSRVLCVMPDNKISPVG